MSALAALGTAAASAGLAPASADPAPTWEPAPRFAQAQSAPAVDTPADVVEDAPALVTLREGVDKAELDALITEVTKVGGTVKARLGKDFPGFTGRLTPRAEQLLRDHPAVDVVEDNSVFTNAGTQGNAPWHLDRIDQVNRAFDKRYSFGGAKKHSTGKGVRIYVVDSGVRASHKQLRGRVAKGASAIGRLSPRKDCGGHGTHVAGLAAGKVSGVAKRATIVPVRVFGCSDKTSARNVVRGINWVTKHRKLPAVMNLSLAGPPNRAVTRAVKRAAKRGVHIVAAAGNEGIDACLRSPSRMKQVLTVGALTRADRPAGFSNHGRCVDIWAPGQGIRSATHKRDKGTRVLSGTSMASPLVAGTLARMLQAQRKLKPAAARKLLMANTPLTVVQLNGGGYLFPTLFTGVRDDLHRAAVPSTSLTRNPGFEAGDDGAWLRRGLTRITNDAGIPAARGAWKAVLGGHGTAGNDGVGQLISVPANAKRPWASFRLRVLSAEGASQQANDQLTVRVLDETTTQSLGILGVFSNRNASPRFARYQLNLRPFRGRTIFLAFEANENEGKATTFIVDDVYAGAS